MRRAVERALAVGRSIAAYSDEISLFLITAFLVVVAANTQSGWLYILVALLIAFLAMGFILPRHALSGLTAARRAGDEAYEGELVSICLAVKNPTRWHKYLLSLADDQWRFPGSETKERQFIVDHLSPGEERVVEYEAPAARRGRYRFAALKIGTSAPFGIFPAKRTVEAPGTLTVLPIPFPGDQEPLHQALLHMTQEGRTIAISGQSHDFLGVRAYAPGEDIRFIHWPSSARSGSLMMQEFMKPGGASVTLFLDTSAASSIGEGLDNTLEYAVKIATTYLHLLRRLNASLRLLTVEGGETHLFAPASLHEGLDFLAGLEATGSLDWRPSLRAAVETVPPGGTLVVVTPRCDFPPDILGEALRRRLVVAALLLDAPSFLAPGASQDGDEYERALGELAAAGYTGRLIRRGGGLAQ